MRIMMPLKDASISKGLEQAERFAFIHFDAQVKKIFNWTQCCPPAGTKKEMLNWLYNRRPQLLVCHGIESQDRINLNENGINTLLVSESYTLEDLFQSILSGSIILDDDTYSDWSWIQKPADNLTIYH